MIDVRGLLDNLNIRWWDEGKNCNEGWVNINCPYCDDPSNHLGISESSGAISCWRCPVTGGLTKLIPTLNPKISPSKARELVARYSTPALGRTAEIGAVPGEIGRTRGSLKIPENFRKLQPPFPPIAEEFLRRRGFHPEVIAHEKKLMISGNFGPYAYRIIIPIYYQGILVSWTARALGNFEPKYQELAPEKSLIPPKNVLYGIDEARPSERIVIVEGPIDQWKLGGGAVASLGTKLSPSQLGILKLMQPSRVFILYDAEPDAQLSAEKAAQSIWFAKTEIVALDGDNDPGDLSSEDARNLMRELR